jgi:hypothetical protein
LRTLVHHVRVFYGERTTPNTSVLIDGAHIAEPDDGHTDVEVDGSGMTQRRPAAERDDVADLRSAGVHRDPTTDITATASIAGTRRRGVHCGG